MTVLPIRSEAGARGARMLRTALGTAISGWLEDAAVIEVMLNPDGRLWVDRLGVGIADTGKRLSPADGERIVRLGEHHLRTLTVTGFPTATFPGILDELNGLAFAYRWSTRAIMLDKTDATKLLSKIRRQWFAKRKSIAAIVKEVMTNEQSALVDSDAANKAADADMALQELVPIMPAWPMSPRR